MVSMIPEQEIFLGTFASIANDSTGNHKTITLNATFVDKFSLIADLYVGCVLEIYLNSNDSFVDKTVVLSNIANKITVPNTLHTDITGTAANYYGILRQFGSPVPAPKGASTGEIGTVTISDGGTQVAGNLYLLDNTEINDTSGISGGSNGEIELTISAHATQMTFATVAADNYENGEVKILDLKSN